MLKKSKFDEAFLQAYEIHAWLQSVGDKELPCIRHELSMRAMAIMKLLRETGFLNVDVTDMEAENPDKLLTLKHMLRCL